MESLYQAGVQLILWLQNLGAWLEGPMRFFTFLGTEDFFLLVLPVLFWSVDTRLGIRVGYVLLISASLNHIFKTILAGPRPYWVSRDVNALALEPSFGAPSGHAQNAVSLWGSMAAYLRRGWAWAAALAVIFLVGVSRLYLAVHFPHDVVLGWLLGALILWLVFRLWDPAAGWLKTLGFGWQVMLAFLVSLAMVLAAALVVAARSGYLLPEAWAANLLSAGADTPEPLALSGILTNAGLFFGLSVGLAWMESRGGFQASGPLPKRVLCYLLGLAGVMVFWYGLGAVLPRGEALLPYILRYLRYTLVGAWVSGGAPWLFKRLKLVGDY